MNIRKVFLILALTFGGYAVADIVTAINAVETVTSNISVPTSPNGRLMFRPCGGECEEKFITVRLTPETTYVVAGEAVDFLGFRQAFYNLRRGSDGYALVSYDTKLETATNVRLGF